MIKNLFVLFFCLMLSACADTGQMSVTQDGLIYIAESPTSTLKSVTVAPSDAPRKMTLNEGKEYCKSKGLRLPNINELWVLYINRDKGSLVGTFNTDPLAIGTFYWSSSILKNSPGAPPDSTISAWGYRFGLTPPYQEYSVDDWHANVRCVR